MDIQDFTAVDAAARTEPAGPEQHALLCVDAAGLVTLAAQTEELLGFRDAQLIGRAADTVFERPQELAGILDAPDTTPRLVQTPCHHADGTTIVLEASLSTAQTTSGPHVRALLRPVARQPHGAVSPGLLTLLTAYSNDAMMATTPHGEITFWNPAAQRMYGYTRDELIGRDVSLLYEQDPQAERDRWIPAITAGQVVRLDRARRRHRDGTTLTCTVTIAPVTDEAGTVVGAVSLTHPNGGAPHPDDARFKALLEAVTIPIVGVDDHGRIVTLNTAAEHLFGYRPAELAGQPVEILIPDDLRARHAGLRDTYLTEPQTRPMGTGMVLFAQRKDGSQLPVEVSLAPINGNDGLMIAVSVRDMSTQVHNERLERQLQHSRRLESIGQLAGGVAHGFNNLISVINGYTRFIRKTARTAAAGDKNSRYAQIAADADRIVDTAERAATLARQLLTFARNERAEAQHLDLNDAVRDATDLLRRSLGEHITITVHPSEEPQPILGDPGQIEQIIMNAAVNARDAMPDGGTLTIDTSRISFNTADAHQRGITSGNYVRLRITDTGTGMSPEIAAKVFEPFYTTKPAGEGTGLGLSTIYGIVTGYGGHVTIYSEPGHGTTLSVLLPSSQEPDPATKTGAPNTPHDTARPGQHTILVVDDEEYLRDIVARDLSDAGHHVLTAPDGPTAIALAERHPGTIDLLLTDVIMPKMLGPALAAQITAGRPGLPVIYMSGYAQPALNDQGTLGDDTVLLEKPFTEHHLHAAVTAALRNVVPPLA